MKSIKILMAITVLLSGTACNAQIKNSKTETVKIYGNCGMCETTIEKAGNKKKIAKVDWNKDTKMATVTYDATKTNQADILKRIALAGYDSDSFLAPDDVYAKLPECCQYERVKKTIAKVEAPAIVPTTPKAEDHSGHNHNGTVQTTTVPKQEASQLKAVFEAYFAIKDVLVKTDGNAASAKAKDLQTAIAAVKMETLSTNEHTIWMKVQKDLVFDAEHINETKDASHQRDHFMSLSKNMYELIKVTKQDAPVYYQFCPMANNGKGANWLSMENAVKNPYYGSQMLTCGKVVETIK
jgi:copper chaperone CopZ